MDDLIGKTIGQYKIVALVGKGGMATVYKAHQASLNRYVALKVLPEYLAHDEEFVQRFKQEAAAAASLRHPNILVVHDIGEAGHLHYIAAEFLEGQTLEQALASGNALPLPRVVKIVNQLASALEAAHQRDMIHRDVKPSNVFLGPADHVTLTDFGIVKAMSAARLTRTGTLIGTPEYMSPEQAEGQPLDRRSDLYSLGVVTYQMLSGQVPFTATTPHAVLYAHVTKPPAPPSQLNPILPKPVESVVLRALAKRPADRFQSVAEFAAALEEAARQTEGDLAAGLYRAARQFLAQGQAVQAQAKLDQLRQISPNYPGLAELAVEVAHQAQIEREYAEIVRLTRQARERAADLARRAPHHPDPERVLKSSLGAPAGPGGRGGWLALWMAGLALALGGVLGFWGIPIRGSWDWWAAGPAVLLSGVLGEATVVPWAALVGTLLVTVVGALATLSQNKVIRRATALVSLALVALSLALVLFLGKETGIAIEWGGPLLVIIGQVMLGVGLAGRLWL